MGGLGIRTTTASDLADHIERLGVAKGANLAVHSSLIAFGRLEGGAATVLRSLRDAVGPEGTLIFPTYTFDTADHAYDPSLSPSTNVGILGELARAQPGAIRSRSVIHSHAGLGPLAGLLADSPPDLSFGAGSDFDRMHKLGFELLLLGCRFEICTFLHQVEAEAAVPYRHWITLPRRLIDPQDHQEKPVTFRYFARKGAEGTGRFDVIEQPLRSGGLLNETDAPYGRSFRTSLAALYQTAMNMLHSDPYALVTGANAPQKTPS